MRGDVGESEGFGDFDDSTFLIIKVLFKIKTLNFQDRSVVVFEVLAPFLDRRKLPIELLVFSLALFIFSGSFLSIDR